MSPPYRAGSRVVVLMLMIQFGLNEVRSIRDLPHERVADP